MPGPATPRTPSPAADDAAARYAARPWLAAYPDGVPADYDFPAVPLTRLLDDAASSWPAQTALAFLGTRIPYRQLKDDVDRLATALTGLGVGKGDRVAVVLPNCPQNVVTTYAALRLGAVVVQHNPLSTEHELRHQLRDCGATVVVCLDRVHDTVERVRPDTAVRHVVVTSLADYLTPGARLRLRLPVRSARRARAELVAPVPAGTAARPFLALLRSATTPTRQTPVDPQTDLALLQYTGGTTGVSKGAMLTHANLVSNAYMNRLWDTGATPGREVCLGVLPLFHAFGLTVAMNATLLLGGTLVLLPRFDLDRVFAAIERWRPTMLPAVPPIYKALSDSPRARTADLRSIRVCVSGAMRLPPEVQEQFERVTGVPLVEGYGLTETSPSTHCNPITGTRKRGTIGVPLPGTECRVVDRDDSSRAVPPGTPGELAVRGPQVFRGYWGRDDGPAPFTDDGFLLTGDIAVMDDDGFFTVVDRKKELIIAGGFNIYPSEVEEALLALPGVAAAAVIGVPDRYRGESVKAFVVREEGARLDEEDVVAHCATLLTAYKVPRVVEFRDSLPRNEVGAVVRRRLLEEERARAEQPAAPSGPGRVPAAGADDGGSGEAGSVDPQTGDDLPGDDLPGDVPGDVPGGVPPSAAASAPAPAAAEVSAADAAASTTGRPAGTPGSGSADEPRNPAPGSGSSQQS